MASQTLAVSNNDTTSEPRARPETDSKVAPEPGPEWNVAIEKWGVCWKLHWIGLGIAFSTVAIISFCSLLFTKKRKSFTRKLLFCPVNSLLVVLGSTRAIFLWVDPYHSGENGVKPPLLLVRILFGLAFPCLTSAFCLVHIAFLEVTKLRVGFRLLNNLAFVLTVTAMHFALFLSSEITLVFKDDRTELLVVCDSFFIVWGLVNSLAFIYSGMKVVLLERNNKKQLKSIQNRTGAQSRDSSLSRNSNFAKVAKITLVTSILGLGCCCMKLYSMFCIYKLYAEHVTPEPWSWFIFQTGFRVIELAMACTLLYCVFQPAKTQRGGFLSRPKCNGRAVKTDVINVRNACPKVGQVNDGLRVGKGRSTMNEGPVTDSSR